MKVIDENIDTSQLPLLSICVPTYNRPQLLKRTLLSLKTSRTDVEIIVTDNSTDSNSKKVVEEILSSYPCQWRYHKNEPAVTPANNMNAGINLSRGAYVYILHDDDFLLPSGLSKILQKIEENPNYHVLKFGVKVVDINERRLFRTLKPVINQKETYYPPQLALKKLLSNSSYVRQPSVVVKKEAYDKVGLWDDSKTPPNDTDMWMRMFSEFGIYNIPDTISAYTVHNGAMTTSSFNYESLAILLGIFETAKQKGVLPAQIYNQCMSSFFHQWILASTFRFLILGDFSTARKIMKLFYSPSMDKLSTSIKWLPLKLVFRMILAV
ncbi:MAG: glycosyltransferase family 2 protein [Bacteroidota bacterium]